MSEMVRNFTRVVLYVLVLVDCDLDGCRIIDCGLSPDRSVRLTQISKVVRLRQ
jgi:hypothetical protein